MWIVATTKPFSFPWLVSNRTTHVMHHSVDIFDIVSSAHWNETSIFVVASSMLPVHPLSGKVHFTVNTFPLVCVNTTLQARLCV